VVKAGFSIGDSDHQGPGQSTPHQEACSRGFKPPEKAIGNSAGLSGVKGENNAHQKALYLCLSDTVHRLVLAVG
jgi:hypothetical protein